MHMLLKAVVAVLVMTAIAAALGVVLGGREATPVFAPTPSPA